MSKVQVRLIGGCASGTVHTADHDARTLQVPKPLRRLTADPSMLGGAGGIVETQVEVYRLESLAFGDNDAPIYFGLARGYSPRGAVLELFEAYAASKRR